MGCPVTVRDPQAEAAEANITGTATTSTSSVFPPTPSGTAPYSSPFGAIMALSTSGRDGILSR